MARTRPGAAGLKKRRRMYVIGLCLLGLGTATALTLTAFEDNILFFYSPGQLADQGIGPGDRFRLGGLVAEDTVVHSDQDTSMRFVVTDGTADMYVQYSGIVPDLFREGQGIVALGRLASDGTFMADELLAKHDENYLPAEVAKALEEQGHGPLTAPERTGNAAIVVN